MPGRFRQAQPTWSGTIRMLEEDYAVFCLGRGGKGATTTPPTKARAQLLPLQRHDDSMPQMLLNCPICMNPR